MLSAVILAVDWMMLGLCKRLLDCHHLFFVCGANSRESAWSGLGEDAAGWNEIRMHFCLPEQIGSVGKNGTDACL